MIRRGALALLLLGTASSLLSGGGGRAAAPPPPAAPPSRLVLPIPPRPFAGRIAPIAGASTPDPSYGEPARAPAGAPNVLLIMTDDVGFGASSTFGGPIPTPTLDRLAQAGLRYNEFHTTAMCSPSRAALLTGRNHHKVGFGILSEMATGFPGYDGRLPKSAATIARVLKGNGYSTAMFGKHHNVPTDERSAAGPFDRWPNGLGFEYFYGFRDSETNQWAPALVENNQLIEPDYAHPELLDSLLADHAVHWLRDHHVNAPDRPFFVYYATGTPHAPQQAPKDWIARFHGKFDRGWDVVRQETFERQKRLGIIPPNTTLTPRTAGIPAWSSLSPARRRVYARMMEVYAAALAYGDFQIGRVIDELQAEGELDNTLVIFIEGDNGASEEGSLTGMTNQWAVAANGVKEDQPYLLSMLDKLGGPYSFENYPVGWAWAMNTPFRWAKQIASHLGGTRNGMVISWPTHVPAGGAIRPQFSHLVDIVPTILEAARVPAPVSVDGIAQQLLDGSSLVYSFGSAAAPERHRTQYFELMGNRAIYNDGWMASTTPRRPPWVMTGSGSTDPLNDYRWELYDLKTDFSQAHNLAGSHPAKLAQLKTLWLEEARRNDVLPVDDRYLDRPRARAVTSRTHFLFHAGDIRIPPTAAPDTDGRSWVPTANVHTTAKTSGVLATLGGRFGGWTFFMKDGQVHFVYALSNQEADHTSVVSPTALTPGDHRLTLDFDFDYKAGGSAHVKLWVDGTLVAQAVVPRTGRQGLTIDETFDVGADSGTPASELYATMMPYPFNGDLRKVVIDVR